MNTMEMFSLNGKVAILTGGCGWLGQAMAEALSDAGATVYVAGTSYDKYRQVYGLAGVIKFVPIDIMSSRSISDAYRKVREQEDQIDILVNNAAHVEGGGKRPEDITDDEWAGCQRGVMESVFKCIREIIPYMSTNGGSIINIASMYGIVSPNLSMYDDVCSPYLNPVDYGACKAGVIQMTRYFGAYLIKRRIRVNAIAPGTFPSPEVQNNKEFLHRLNEKNPAGRIGVPADLKGTIIYLASNASSYVVGQTIQVDGGWTIW